MTKRAGLKELGQEPYRLFFPLGVATGIVGALMWPLHFAKLISLYPGQAHAHVMALGMFGAFIFGFLGTAMPRMLSAPALGVRNVLTLAALHAAMVTTFAVQMLAWGERIFLAELCFFLTLMLVRFAKRQDTPPPGFVLVGLAMACAVLGSAIGLFQPWMDEESASWVTLQRLLLYQGFVLLPILGIGPFLLPRFFGMPSSHSFDEMLKPTRSWKRKASLALAIGAIVLGSFVLEMRGSVRTGNLVRFAAVAAYLYLEFPFRAAPKLKTSLGFALAVAFGLLVSGFLLVGAFPAFRVSLLHLTFIGGFTVVTFVVATRVIFGHSGNLEKLKQKNRWLALAVIIMLLAMITRISGDFFPKVMTPHYIYGALLWVIAVVLWGAYTIPKVFLTEEE
jgi:uncharacterized protein involved in response to NO